MPRERAPGYKYNSEATKQRQAPMPRRRALSPHANNGPHPGPTGAVPASHRSLCVPVTKACRPLHAHSAQRPESPPRLGGAACPDQQNSSASCCRLAPARGYATASAVANARKTPNRTPSPTRQPPPWPNHCRTTALRATAPFFVNRLFVTGHKGAVSRGRHEEAAGGSRHRASESPLGLVGACSVRRV